MYFSHATSAFSQAIRLDASEEVEPAILPMSPVDGGSDSEGEGWMDEVVENPAIENTKPISPNEAVPAAPPLIVPRLQLPTFPVTAMGTARRAEPPSEGPTMGAYTQREWEIGQMQLTARSGLRAAPTSAEMHRNQKSERMSALNQVRRKEREGRKGGSVRSGTETARGSSVYGTEGDDSPMLALQGGSWTVREATAHTGEFKQRRARPQTAKAIRGPGHPLAGSVPGEAENHYVPDGRGKGGAATARQSLPLRAPEACLLRFYCTHYLVIIRLISTSNRIQIHTHGTNTQLVSTI